MLARAALLSQDWVSCHGSGDRTALAHCSCRLYSLLPFYFLPLSLLFCNASSAYRRTYSTALGELNCFHSRNRYCKLTQPVHKAYAFSSQIRYVETLSCSKDSCCLSFFASQSHKHSKVWYLASLVQIIFSCLWEINCFNENHQYFLAREQFSGKWNEVAHCWMERLVSHSQRSTGEMVCFIFRDCLEQWLTYCRYRSHGRRIWDYIICPSLWRF